ncbi:MAG: threonine--tRNA ligase [Deltaproteobacteria bacterium]
MELDTLRHSCAHVMAKAVKQLWPDVKLTIGPSIEDGFYYDFERKEPFTDEDLAGIEKRMSEIIARNEPFTREELSKEEAIQLFEKKGETFKVELIKDLTDGQISAYKTGDDFVDLCKGPHIKSTGEIKAFKLLSVAGAYWHGIETNPALQRIYGTCFENRKQLDGYLKDIEERKLRDHRKMGPQLELYDIYEKEAGSGLVFYHPKGAVLRGIIEDYEKTEHRKRGYHTVITPHIMQAELWKRSGHMDFYRENMYVMKIDDKDFVLKPMNCPGHILIYQSKTRSYRDLPLRLFELGTVYRHEKAGVMHGLMRVRGFTQDDAHIFCLPSQVRDEIKGVIDFVFQTMDVFGFKDISIELSTRPEKSVGTDEIWTMATAALEDSLKDKGLKYDVHEGEGAFYGPKIDIKLKDALKRTWQCATIQCDFNLPQRFDLNYVDSDGTQKQPIMLHRVLLGSVERFVACLTEQYAGGFPLWLAPVQAVVIPVREDYREYAEQVVSQLLQKDIRAELNAGTETLNKRIRQAELSKIPYVLVVGEREKASGGVSVRKRKTGDLGAMPLPDLIARLQEETAKKAT